MNLPDTFLYFAYGSNLKSGEIRRTCPSAEFVCRALLPGHRLCFPRGSAGRRGGVAGVEVAAGADVPGVVYRIADSDLPELDRREGYREGRPAADNAYWRSEVTVRIEGDPARPLPVRIYFANPQPDPPAPSADYLQLIIDGAREWGLDPAYISRLEEMGSPHQP